MSAIHDFAALPDPDHEIDPPTYDILPAAPPDYDGPPTYKDAITDEDGEIVDIGRRFYPAPRHVQLSPLEVSLLRSGVKLPFIVGIPNVDMQGKGLRAAMKWAFYRYVGLMLVEVTSENVDDYGRWAWGSKAQCEAEGILGGQKHFLVCGWMIKRKTAAC